MPPGSLRGQHSPQCSAPPGPAAMGGAPRSPDSPRRSGLPSVRVAVQSSPRYSPSNCHVTNFAWCVCKGTGTAAGPATVPRHRPGVTEMPRHPPPRGSCPTRPHLEDSFGADALSHEVQHLGVEAAVVVHVPNQCGEDLGTGRGSAEGTGTTPSPCPWLELWAGTPSPSDNPHPSWWHLCATQPPFQSLTATPRPPTVPGPPQGLTSVGLSCRSPTKVALKW